MNGEVVSPPSLHAVLAAPSSIAETCSAPHGCDARLVRAQRPALEPRKTLLAVLLCPAPTYFLR